MGQQPGNSRNYEPLDPQASAVERVKAWLVCGFLLLMVLLVYGQACQFEFTVCDDDPYVYGNPHVIDGLSLGAWRSWTDNPLYWSLTATHAGNWHPLTWMSHIIDGQLYGVHDTYHFWRRVAGALEGPRGRLPPLDQRSVARRGGNGAISGLAAIDGRFLVQRPGGGDLRLASLAGRVGRLGGGTQGRLKRAVLDADAVGLRRLRPPPQHRPLSGLGGRVRPGIDGQVDAGDAPLRAAAVGLLAAAALAAVAGEHRTGPFPLSAVAVESFIVENCNCSDRKALADGASGSHPLGSLIVEKLPLFALSAIVSWIVARPAEHGLHEHDRQRDDALSHLQRGVFRGRLSLEADLADQSVRVVSSRAAGNQPGGLLSAPGGDGRRRKARLVWYGIGGGLVVIAITALVLWNLRRRPYLAVGWFWYLGTLVPVIGLIQVGAQGMADRYTYLPMIGVYIMIVWAWPSWSSGCPIYEPPSASRRRSCWPPGRR